MQEYQIDHSRPDYDFGKYGLRVDGTKKGQGWNGNIGTDQSPMTELSIGVTFDGKDVLLPLIVPTMTPDELQMIKSMPLNELPKEIINKAVQHAVGQMKQGKSPFMGEQ